MNSCIFDVSSLLYGSRVDFTDGRENASSPCGSKTYILCAHAQGYSSVGDRERVGLKNRLNSNSYFLTLSYGEM